MGLGRLLIGLGLVLLLAGGVVILLSRIGLTPGRLPGNISYRRRNFSFFFPLGTCLILSIVLSLVLYLVNYLRR